MKRVYSAILLTAAFVGLSWSTSNAALYATFNWDPPCFQDSTRFYDYSTQGGGGPIVAWAWDFGDGNGSAMKDPVHMYADTGNYMVKLLITDSAGGQDSMTMNVPVYRCLNADFSWGSMCFGDSTDFWGNQAGIDSIMAWSWNFGDPASGAANTSTLQDPKHLFTSEQLYTVTLYATDTTGHQDTIVHYINIEHCPIADFNWDTFKECIGDTTPFFGMNYGDSIESWDWDFGDPASGVNNTANFQYPYHAFTDTGDFTVRLIAQDTSGSIDTIYHQIHIKDCPGLDADFNYGGPACKDDSTHFWDVSYVPPSDWIVSWDWDFGDGTGTSTLSHPGYVYTTADSFNVRLIVTDNHGGKDTAFMWVHIDTCPPPPMIQANFWAHGPQCKNDTTFFMDSSSPGVHPIDNWSWDFGDQTGPSTLQNPAHVYADTGNYSVQLIVTDTAGVSDTTSQMIFIGDCPALIAQFSSHGPMCKNDSTFFTSNSWGPDSIISWNWDFGDGSGTSTMEHPGYVYADTGHYAVRLIVQDNKSAIDTVIDTLWIGECGPPGPIADFDIDGDCNGDTIFFNAWQMGPDSIESWDWDFGGDGIASGMNVNHLFSDTGFYNVRLIAQDTTGKIDTVYQGIFIWDCPPLTAEFHTTGPQCKNDTTYFVDTSYGPDSTTTWNWDFGDGSGTSTQQFPKYVYADTGMYNVRLIVTDSEADVDTVINPVWIGECMGPGPIADFNINGHNCLGDTVYMNAWQMGPDSIESWDWDFGGDGIASGMNTQHAFSDTGFYNVRLIVQDTSGTIDTIYHGFHVEECPPPDFDWIGNCLDSAIQFNSLFGEPVDSTRWHFGDGNTGSGTNPMHTYTTIDSFEVMMVIYDSIFSDTVHKWIHIVDCTPVCFADAGPDTVMCEGGMATLMGNNPGASTYLWSTTETTAAINVSPSVTTQYVLEVQYPNSCIAHDTVEVMIHSKPAANAGADQVICDGGNVQLNASGGTNYHWMPAAGLSDPNIANPTSSPPTTTVYAVDVTDTNGCTASDTITVTVNTTPMVLASLDTNICVGDAAQLGATGASTYSWSPATGLSSTTISNPTASPSSTTQYVVTGTDGNGCVGTDTVEVAVHALPTATTVNDTAICNGDMVVLNAFGGSSYVWTPSAGLSDPNIANPDASPSATTTYTVDVTDVNGCTDNATVTITVNAGPTADAGTDQVICEGESAALSASGGTSYAWAPAADLDNPNSATPNASPMFTTIYFVDVSDANGCHDMDSVTVTVNTKPIATTGADEIICAGETVTLNASGGDSYNWSPAAGLSSTTVANPDANPTATTAYSVVVTNSVTGCSDTASITVTVNPAATADAGADVTVCGDSAVSLLASGGADYVWSPATGLTNPNVKDPLAHATATITYVVTATDANGCSASDSVTITVNDIPMVDITVTDATCGNSNGQATANATGGGGSYSYMWSNAQTTATATGLSATSYTVNVTDANGCEADAIANVGNADGPSTDSTITSDASCTSECDGAAGIYISGGTGPYSYLWTSGETTAFVSSVCVGTYTVTVTDANLCQLEAAVEVKSVGFDPNIAGKVTIDGAPVTNGYVELFRFGTVAALDLIATVPVDTNGNYSLPSFPAGEYLIAATADTNYYPHAIKTYLDTSTKWIDADTVTSICNGINTVDINVINLAPQNGNGKITGTVKDVSGGKAKAAGDPIPGIDVSLEQVPGGQVVAQSVTDSSGGYTFTGIEDGNYSIYVDIPGLGMIESYEVEITPTDTVVEDNDYFVDSTGTIDTVQPDITHVIAIATNNKKYDLTAFPNPYRDVTNIACTLDSESEVTLEVFNLIGESMMLIINGTQRAGDYRYAISADNIGGANGVYFVKLRVNGQENILRLVLTR